MVLLLKRVLLNSNKVISLMESSAISLIIVQGPRQGETLDFPPGSTIRIGRVVRGNSIGIKDAGISTKHLFIESDSVSGNWLLRDLDSSNGTFVNDIKLPPQEPFSLSDGDTIKLGELTSMLVRISSNEECRSRRNPRRKAAEKCTGLDTVGSVAGTRGRRGKAVEDVSVLAGGGDDTGMESGRYLRPRKGRAVKGEITNQVPDCKKIENNLDVGRESKNVSILETEPSSKVTTRSTRRTKNTVAVATDSVLGNVPENSCVGGEVKAEAKKTRGGARGRKKLQTEPPDCSTVIKLEPSENVEQKRNSLVDDRRGNENVNVEETGSGSSPHEVCDQEENENVGIISESCDEVDDGRASPDEGLVCKAEKAPDLKKMTLGEWFDYLETHLPKQIIDATEEIVSGMRVKSAQVREYVAQQKLENFRGG